MISSFLYMFLHSKNNSASQQGLASVGIQIPNFWEGQIKAAKRANHLGHHTFLWESQYPIIMQAHFGAANRWNVQAAHR